MKKIMALTAILTTVPLFFTGVSAFAQEVHDTHPASALEQLCEKGIIQGYEDGQLRPDYKLTRAEFSKILCNMFPDTATTKKYYEFSDLSETHWAGDYIQKVANVGWLRGFEDGTFRPDNYITYEQVVTVLCRASGVIRYDAEYPYGYISAAIEYSLTDGAEVLIGEDISRGQTAILIVNTLGYMDANQMRTAATYYQTNTAMVPSESEAAKGGGGGVSGIASSSGVVIREAMDYDGFAGMPYQNTEEYFTNEENIFRDALKSPLSTFSIDADTASYSNMRRLILNGSKIPDGAIRSEELINYFNYTSAQTEEGKPFGVKYTYADCPWNHENKLAMITVSGEELTQPAPSNIVFLIDVSGSMSSYNKLPLVKQALTMLLDKLGEEDMISIVTYASRTGVALEPTPATQKEKILGVLDGLMAGGSTAGASGIKMAYEQAEKFKCDGNNRVIICTDGDFNVGISSAEELEKLITKKRESGVFLSVLGFGMGNYKDGKMERLADCGNGNYAYIDNLREAKKVLVDEMPKTIYTIAKDVKIQAEFNPEKVESYRLIGYENRILQTEDFENDEKDAGELGAGASVTVLYEIVPRDGNIESPFKYQQLEGTESDELMTVKIRYKHPDGDESILTEYPVSAEINSNPDADFCFAAAVAELGMLLNNSEFKGSADYSSVIELARKGLGDDEFGFRHEFVQLVDLLRYRNK